VARQGGADKLSENLMGCGNCRKGGGCWDLWREWNRRVFSDQRKYSTELGNAAEQDIRLWLQFCQIVLWSCNYNSLHVCM
jgi:hypothetical protein